jgi:hypothetical protein
MARHFLSACLTLLASFFVALALVYNDEGFTWGYYLAPLPQVSPGAIHIQPLQG